MRSFAPRSVPVLIALVLLVALVAPAEGKPGKGRGKGKGEGGGEGHGRRAVAALEIPPGHLPPPGSCRIWTPGVPPGHQAPPGPCRRLERQLRPGDWLVYRPRAEREPDIVYVDVPDPSHPSALLEVRVFDVGNGHFLRLDAAKRRAWRRR